MIRIFDAFGNIVGTSPNLFGACISGPNRELESTLLRRTRDVLGMAPGVMSELVADAALLGEPLVSPSSPGGLLAEREEGETLILLRALAGARVVPGIAAVGAGFRLALAGEGCDIGSSFRRRDLTTEQLGKRECHCLYPFLWLNRVFFERGVKPDNRSVYKYNVTC